MDKCLIIVVFGLEMNLFRKKGTRITGKSAKMVWGNEL